MNHTLALQRENSRREYEELGEGGRRGYQPEDPRGYSVYPASELGMLRRAVDSSLEKAEREQAVFTATAVDRTQVDLDWFKDDLMEHLRVIRYSAPTYYRSPIFASLFVLMLAGHVVILIGVLGTISRAQGSSGAFGSSVFDAIIAGWTIYNCLALTIVAISPLLLTSLPRGIWRLIGGESHRIIKFFVLTAAVPPLLTVWVFSNGGRSAAPFILFAFFAHIVLPLVIRNLAGRSIRRQIQRLWPQVDRIAGALESDEDSTYLMSLLKRKVIGTPGASLGTSGFAADQVAGGVAGERKTATVLDEFARSKDNAIVFHSVRWNMDGAPYDIDHVVVIGQRVFFLDSKNWSKGNYTMLESADTVLKDGAPIPNGNIHVQSGADSYIKAFGLTRSITQVVVWAEGQLSNQNTAGPRLVTGQEMLDWLHQSAREETIAEGYNVPLLRRLEAKTVQ